MLYSTFVTAFEIRKCDASSLIPSLMIALAIQGSLWSPANFRTVCSISVKMYLLLFILTHKNVPYIVYFKHIFIHISSPSKSMFQELIFIKIQLSESTLTCLF